MNENVYEARIKTKFGELIIHFKDREDLEKKLAQVVELSSIIEKETSGIVSKEQAKVIPGLEDIYTIEADGSIKLLKLPKCKSDTIKLALFLSPIPLNYTQLKRITGISEPSAYMKGKEDFMKNSDGTYSLTPEGRNKVVNKIIPSLRPSKSEERR